MPRQDFFCPCCGRLVRDLVYDSPEYTADFRRITPWPACPSCGGEMEMRPSRSSHDLLPDGFTVDLGDNDVRTFSSLSEVRTFERESERRARNGEGAPMIFRDLSQDRNNREKNTLAGSSYERSRQVPTRDFLRTSRGRPIRGGARSPQE